MSDNPAVEVPLAYDDRADVGPHKGSQDLHQSATEAAPLSLHQLDLKQCYTFCGSVGFGSEEAAVTALRTLQLQPEMCPGKVAVQLQVTENTLLLEVFSPDRQLLRAAVEQLYDTLKIHTSSH